MHIPTGDISLQTVTEVSVIYVRDWNDHWLHHIITDRKTFVAKLIDHDQLT